MVQFTKCQRICVLLYLLTPKRSHYEKALRRLPVMSGYAGSPLLKKMIQEKNTLKGWSVNLKKGSAGRVAG